MNIDFGPHADKVCSAREAVAAIKSGSRLFAGTACATPRALLSALETLPDPPHDITIYSFLTNGALPLKNGVPYSRFRHKCFFVGTDHREAVRQGTADYIPMSLAQLPALLESGRFPVDIAFIQVSAPDCNGYVSLGVSVDISRAAVQHARQVIAEVNPNMPFTYGDSTLHLDRIDRIVLQNTPVIEYLHQPIDDIARRIAAYIAGIIEDESTLQIGLGRIPNEALRYLTDRTNLGIHSDVITDSLLDLIECGVVTGQKKSMHPDKVLTSYCLGTRRLYDFINRNPLFEFKPIEYICDPFVISRHRRMVSVSQAFAIDLTGQICTDQLDGTFYGGVSTQPDFLRGAARSPGGKPIVCLRSTNDDGSSTIRPQLLPGEAAGITRADIHYVITEYGVTYLFGKSIAERAISLIELAHPDFRPGLLEEAKRLGYLQASQTLKSHGSYRIAEERVVTLSNKAVVRLRPARASDLGAIVELFHALSEEDIYTRFFNRIRSLKVDDAQRLCDVNFEDEVAFIAVSGERENEKIVGSACYFLNRTTHIAEVGYMVSKDWQSCGLGKALQQRMQEHAVAAGIEGFKSEVLSSNMKMIALAQRGGNRVTTNHDGNTVEITVYFGPGKSGA